jgi:hypothetical protein
VRTGPTFQEPVPQRVRQSHLRHPGENRDDGTAIAFHLPVLHDHGSFSLMSMQP